MIKDIVVVKAFLKSFKIQLKKEKKMKKAGKESRFVKLMTIIHQFGVFGISFCFGLVFYFSA